ncbi:hypothetical protein [Dyadobacter luticola]|uniref:Uncharacterized protein n=1 Tax=Dyadobacter luticola TaxID=1979387 RepID=A0A5R9KP09_9BACT|nr:hypothetical protein [Dyadobacter luticola]TLU98021.1 hypothetical protein FEN17_24855 [Dyadobacter luticola]
MQRFPSIIDAFDWWIKNEYPSLSPDLKKGKLTDAWRDYIHKKSISESRMKKILVEYGHFDIHIIITRKP